MFISIIESNCFCYRVTCHTILVNTGLICHNSGASQRPCHDVVSLGVICNYNYTVCVSVTVMSVMPHASRPRLSVPLSTLATLATSWLFGSPEHLQFHPDNQQTNTGITSTSKCSVTYKNCRLYELRSLNYQMFRCGAEMDNYKSIYLDR